ncbi:MAG: hypothetical protein ACN4GT_08875 [Gammaproteobacteria bacterium]
MIAIMEIIVTLFALALAATCTVAVILEKLKRDRASGHDTRRQQMAQVGKAD